MKEEVREGHRLHSGSLLTLFIRYLITTHYDYWQLVKFHGWPHYSQLKYYL